MIALIFLFSVWFTAGISLDHDVSCSTQDAVLAFVAISSPNEVVFVSYSSFDSLRDIPPVSTTWFQEHLLNNSALLSGNAWARLLILSFTYRLLH